MGKKNVGMMDWFKGSDALNLVTMAQHTKSDAEGNDISHQHCSICDADFEDDTAYNDHMMAHENDRIAEENRVAEENAAEESRIAEENRVAEQNARMEENNRVLAQQQQEVMDETANDVAYTPEDENAWTQEMTQESYDESAVPAVDPREINQEYSNPVSEESVAFNSSVDNATLGTMDIVNTIAEEETPVVDKTYYQNLAPTDNTILPSSENVSDAQSSPNPSYDVMGNPLDYESDYTAEEGNQGFPGKEPIGNNIGGGEEAKPKSPPDNVEKKDITTVFQKDDRVYYAGKIYVVQGTDENGIVTAIGMDGSVLTVSQSALKSETMVAQEYQPGEWEAAEENSQPKQETQTETETAQEESPPDETVTKPILIYFEAYQDANIPISAVNNNSPFVVRWKVDNKNGKVIIQSDSGLEKEGDMGTMPQQMGDVAMTYSLFAFDKENNVLSPSPWILTVESAEKEESMEVSNLKVETLEITPNKKEVRWKIDNFDSSMGLRMQVISNGVVIKDEVIPSGEGGMAI
jgi:hypothetical protein